MTGSQLQPPAQETLFVRLSRWADATFGTERDSIDQTVAGLLSALWRKRLIILAFAFLGTIAGFVTAHVLEKKYVAYMRVIPNVEEQLGSGLAGSLSSLGSLGGLTGGLTKPERVTPFQQYLAIMTSREVAHEMQRRGNFLAALYPNLWDAKKYAWKPPQSDIWSTTKRLIKQALGLPTPPHPTEEDLANQIARRVGVTEDKEVSIYVISMAYKDPVFARHFIQALYDSTEEVLLRRDRDVATREVAGAERELEKTTISSNRDALTEILVMLNLRLIQTNVGSPYAARILSGVEAGDFPSIPSVPAYMLYGLLTGLLTVCCIIIAYAVARARKLP